MKICFCNDKIKDIKYSMAVKLFDGKKCEDDLLVFNEIQNYKNSKQKENLINPLTLY